MPRPALLLLALLACPLARAQQQDLPLDNLAELERVSRELELHGRQSLTLDQVQPPLPDGLRYVTDQNDEERERSFHEAWLKAYQGICEALVDQATEVCGDALKDRDREREPAQRLKPLLKKLKKLARKQPAAAEALAALKAVLPTYETILRARQGEDLNALWASRRQEADAFLKRYDFGPGVATAQRSGTCVIEVQLPPDTWQLVRGELDSWHYTPLMGADNKQVTLGDQQVEWGQQLNQGQVREALQRLSHLEFFTVRYAEVKNETPTGEFARVTGVHLTFGTYFFFQYAGRVMVFRAPER